MCDGEQKKPVLAAAPELLTSCGLPSWPQKTPELILVGTQEAALLSPMELNVTGIPLP